MVHFAFLPLKAAFHKFSTLLLTTFDPITRFCSTFFKLSLMIRPIRPKRFYASKLTLSCITNQKTQNFGLVGSEKWVGGGPFCKIKKNCFEIFHTQQKTHPML